MNCNLVKKLQNLNRLIIPHDLRFENKIMDINSCKKTSCHENITNESKTNNKESNYGIPSNPPGAHESVIEYTIESIDKSIPKESFNLDFKFKSQKDITNQEHLIFKNHFHKNDRSPISEESKESDTLIIHCDESDTDYNISENEKINFDKTEKGDNNFEKRRDNQEISQKINCTNSNVGENKVSNVYENCSCKIARFNVFNSEYDSKMTREHQPLANTRNGNTNHEICDEKINTSHTSNSKIDFKSPKIDQKRDNIEQEDPDILKIFYDESDIDSYNKSDSEINGKNIEVKVIKPECDLDVSVSDDPIRNYLTLLNYIKNDNKLVKSEINANFIPDTIQSAQNTIPETIQDAENTISKAIQNAENLIPGVMQSAKITIPEIILSAENTTPVNIQSIENTSPEIMQRAENTIPDYYEEEIEDLINPGWNKIKSLSTDEERCNEVSKCWLSPCVPDPTKNLTYYSYRKRFLCTQEDDINERRPLKRRASTSLDEQNAKRVRLCTYIADDRIKSIEKERDMKMEELRMELESVIKERSEKYRSIEKKWEQKYLNSKETIGNFEEVNMAKLRHIRDQFERESKNLEARYEKRFQSLQNEYIPKINESYKRRREILEFCKFYKVSKTHSGRDPTLLTRDQQLILDEIENIYKQQDFFYRDG